MAPPAPGRRADGLAKAQIEYVAMPPPTHSGTHATDLRLSIRLIKGIAQRLYTSEIFPLASVKYMVMTWQAGSQVIGDAKDPDDEEVCPGADGGEVNEEEYNRSVHVISGLLALR